MELAVRERDSSVQPASDTHGERFKWGLDRFMAEAQTLARFKHPNIMRVLAVFEANGTGYMVMEYEHGDTLHEILTRRQTLHRAGRRIPAQSVWATRHAGECLGMARRLLSTTATSAHRLMGRRGPLATAPIACSGVVPGTTSRGACVPPTVPGTRPASGSATWVSASSRTANPLNSMLLLFWLRAAVKPRRLSKNGLSEIIPRRRCNLATICCCGWSRSWINFRARGALRSASTDAVSPYRSFADLARGMLCASRRYSETPTRAMCSRSGPCAMLP